MQLFDAHSHLLDPDAIARAADKGVVGIAVCGTSPEDWPQIFQCLEKNPAVYPMLGIHPWFVSKPWKKSFQCLEKLLRDFPKLGIGEVGLDFSEKFENRAEQEECFAAHLDLARKLNRPVAVHCVKAWGRLIEIIKKHPVPKIILHAYGGSPELVPELVKLNCWFSFGPRVLNPNAKKVRASAVAVPDDRLLVETDSLDVLSTSCKRFNEPVRLLHVARVVAQVRGVSADQVARMIMRNVCVVFSLNSTF